jgi:hypothetical protein
MPALMAACLAVLAGAACSNGNTGTLTLEEFMQELLALHAELEAGSSGASATFEAAGDAGVDQLPDAVEAQIGIVEQFATGVEELDAPEEAPEIQQDIVDASREVAVVAEGALDEAEAASSIEEFFSLVGLDFQAAAERQAEACFQAELLAAEHDVDITLACREQAE